MTAFRQQGRVRQRASFIYSDWVLASALVPLFAYSLLLLPSSTAPCQAQAATKSSTAHARLSGHAKFSRRSDAESGVQLLETIISRVMNIPQVALNKSSSQLAQSLKQQANSNSPTDYKLAIRPKEAGKSFAAAPKLPLVIAQAPNLNAALDSIFHGAPPSQVLGGGSPGASDALMGDEGTADTWRGGSLSRVSLRNESGANQERTGVWEDKMLASAGAGANAESAAPRATPATPAVQYPSVRNRASGGLPATNLGKFIHAPGDNQYAAAEGSVAVKGMLQNRLAAAPAAAMPARKKADYSAEEENRRQIPDLATAVNRLYKVSKGLEDIETVTANASNAANSGNSSNAAPLLASSTQKAKFYGAPREIQIIDDRPVVKDFREAPSAAAGLQLNSNSAGKANAAGGAGAGMGSRGALHSRAAKAKASFGGYMKNELKPLSDYRGGVRDKLALLPPNVATGIPTMNLNLGATEVQALQALAHAGGKLKQQRIRNWTVYSWTKKQDEGSADDLQLYFRHGLLDAIRIFDSDLISGGFGVSPGDQLEVVKERFGEPAFLLPEPTAEGSRRDNNSGKNYIYPISQVGFQLARHNSDSAPQVVSVLIFSVK